MMEASIPHVIECFEDIGWAFIIRSKMAASLVIESTTLRLKEELILGVIHHKNAIRAQTMRTSTQFIILWTTLMTFACTLGLRDRYKLCTLTLTFTDLDLHLCSVP